MNELFFSLGMIIIIGTVFAYLAKLIRQPMIPAYVLTGIVLGPMLGLITNSHVISTMSEIGIAFLLFIVGLEIDMKKLSTVGLVSTLGGLTQIIAVFSVGFVVSLVLGFFVKEAIYIGIIVAFSSTMVVVKLLSDKREIDTLHGRIAIGILLVQDIVAILAMSTLTSMNGSFIPVLYSFFEGLIILAIAVLSSKYIFPTLFKFAAKSQELLFLLSISSCLAFAILANYFGQSIVIGAFVAGVALANLPYTIEIMGRVKSLRDFFAPIFFVSLGLELSLGSFKGIIVPLIIFVGLTITLKPFIIMFICSFFGYKKRISFLTSLSLAQISEFSLILVSQGFLLGQVSEELFSLTVMMAIITITTTAYFVKYEDFLYKKLRNVLKPLDRFTENESKLEYLPKKRRNHIILCGYNRISYSIAKTLKRMKKGLLVVDFNPEVIVKLIRERIPSMYGDIGDIEVLDRLELKHAYMVVSTVPTKQDNILLIRKVKEVNKHAIIFVTANKVEEALSLYDEGADYVILPHFLGGEHVSVLIEDYTGDVNKIIETKLNHIKELKNRRELGHEHSRHH